MSFRLSSTFAIAAGALLAAGGFARVNAATTEWHAPALVGNRTHVAVSDRPYWVDESLEPSNRAHIARIAYDVVLLDGGLYQGFRTGVVCTVQRSGLPVAQLIVVASEEHRAAALITALPNTVIITPGDEVHVSTL